MGSRAASGSELERAKDYASPTAKLTTADSAYGTQVGAKEHLRWVMPTPEVDLLNALARLHATAAPRGELTLGVSRSMAELASGPVGVVSDMGLPTIQG